MHSNLRRALPVGRYRALELEPRWTPLDATMIRIKPLLLLSTCTAGLLLAGTALVQDAPPSPQDLAEMRRLMMESAQPGPEHELLARYVGAFEQDVTVWPAQGAQPVKFKGQAQTRMILGGRYLEQTGTSKFMGMETESLSLVGFDRRHQEFTIIGLDTVGTYWVSGQGPYDPETKTATMRGTDEDPIGGVTQDFDFRLTFVDDDTLRTEIWFRDAAHSKDGKPFKMVEVVSRRKE